ncbi:MAG: cytochrome-c oxidase, cbb3-type subunit II [Deltaproteobacteria bacterium CG_4_9_14_3_um_filter_63_12]|nr:MAG: cytochrome-c oxidase, cbb3-type subunit II [Deltaproteobacteria bacterium CG_4_9_14_3_um_filter_63_12]
MKMLEKFDFNAGFFAACALLIFLVGATITTAYPAFTEDSWSKPNDGLHQYSESQLNGREVYKREGCWYCHTQQIRTLEPDTKRYGWRGVDAPISVPSEYVNDYPHFLGTRRIGPDLARVGGKYDKSWHRAHFMNPRDLVPGSIMPPFPWLIADDNGRDFDDLVNYLQTLGRSRDWRPAHDYEQ